MDMYFPLFLVFCMGLYMLDCHTIVKNTVVAKYTRFRELNRFVGIKYKTIGMILWVSCAMIGKMLWLNLLHWFNNSVQHVDKQHAIISYVLNGKLYRLAMPVRRGPPSVLLITDEDREDVTDTIAPFMGPNEDWHGQRYTPAFWKKRTLTFEMCTGAEPRTFSERETIVLA